MQTCNHANSGLYKVTWQNCCGNMLSCSTTWVGAVPHGKLGAYHGKPPGYHF